MFQISISSLIKTEISYTRQHGASRGAAAGQLVQAVGSAAGCRRWRSRTKRKALQLSAMGAAVAAGAQKLRGVRSAEFLQR